MMLACTKLNECMTRSKTKLLKSKYVRSGDYCISLCKNNKQEEIWYANDHHDEKNGQNYGWSNEVILINSCGFVKNENEV